MKRLLTLAAVSLTLAGCGSKTESPTLNQLLDNPLFAELYAEELVNVLTELEIYEDPILEEDGMQEHVTRKKNEWMEIARDARTAQRGSMIGDLIPMKQYTVGEVMLTDSMLYFGPTFESEPGTSVHVYISTVIDPRDAEFPDASAIDVGVLPTPYGAHNMELSETLENPALYRTVVLWDTDLNRLYGFAQINPY